MSAVLVSDVVQAFSFAFNSVDLRVVAVRPEDEWLNAIASLFLSTKSPEQIMSEQQQAREKLPNTDRFLIYLDSYDFKALPQLFTQFNTGRIVAGKISIKSRDFYPSELRVDQFLPRYLKEMEDWKLVGAQADERKDDTIWKIIDSQNGHARNLGYKDIYELIREALRIGEFDRGRSQGLVIGIPMPARIADVSLVGSSIQIKTKKVFGLTGLQFNLTIGRFAPRTNRYECVFRKTELVKKCKHRPTHEFCHVTNSIQLTNLIPHDRIDVELIHRQVPILSIDKTFLNAPLQNAVEPFAKTLFNFCSFDLFRKRLFNPEEFKKSSKEFENAVAWLLSLIGFSVAQLGRFEKLKIAETGYEVGSIDLIAYRENEAVLLVDCDTSIPDEKKIRSMTSVKNHFKFIQDEYRQPRIFSAIFSPKDCVGISKSETVKIVDKHGIKSAYEEAMKGNLSKARSFLVY